MSLESASRAVKIQMSPSPGKGVSNSNLAPIPRFPSSLIRLDALLPRQGNAAASLQQTCRK